MASDKIVSKILENAQSEAGSITQSAKEKAAQAVAQTQKQTQAKLAQMKKQFDADCDETKRRGKLNAGLEERKDLLAAKRSVMDEAFDAAYQKMKDLPEDKWDKLICEIITKGVQTGTEMIKVPQKDMAKYQKGYLKQLNDMLVRQGRVGKLTLDEDPARFEEGLMIIGEYSDVNASFRVLLENQKKSLEYEVTKILFSPEQPEV